MQNSLKNSFSLSYFIEMEPKMLSVRDERTECTIKIGSLFKKNILNHLLHYIGK